MRDLQPQHSTVKGSIHFLSRDDLYREEKPYTIRYTLPEDVPRTNSTHDEHHDIPIEDIRNRVADFSLTKNGFGIIKLESSMKYEDFASEDLVVGRYLAEAARALREKLNARHVQIYEHTPRRRDAAYPVSTGQQYKFDQPTNTAHIDVTAEYLKQLVVRLNGERAGSMSQHVVQCINVWKPLRGPLNDWPLTVCDASTVDVEQDLVPSDQVFPQHVVENIQIHFNVDQRWYYRSEQTPDELWVFQQSREAPGSDLKSGTPHCSFRNPDAKDDGMLRESIECRALVYYGECKGQCLGKRKQIEWCLRRS